ncbi:MAG: CPBP family intramembrane glutamic endopeptidase [Planctomycetota bacterium]
MSDPEGPPPEPASEPPAAPAGGEGPTALVPAAEPGGGTGLALAVGMPCPGCGAPLAPRVYFCVVCARPWRDERDVLPALRPAPPTDGELLRKKVPQVWTLFWTYVVVVLGGTAVVIATAGREHLGASMVVLDVLLLLVTAVFSVTYGATLKPALTRTGFASPWGWAAVGAVVPLLLVNYGYARLLEALGAPSGDPFEVFSDAGMSHAAVVFLVAVFPAVSEELAFRGLILPWMHAAVGEKKAIVYSAALFAALHLSLLHLPYLFAVGWVLGLARVRSRSLYPPMILHFLHNLGVVEFFTR